MIIQGDVLEVTKGFEDNTFDAMLTDPPYGLSFMGKGWDTFKPSHLEKEKKLKQRKLKLKKSKGSDGCSAWIAGAYDRSLQGQRGFQEFMTRWAKETLRVLKPGAFCLVFGGTRTWHRLACALEDAGFEMRDTVLELGGEFQPLFWLYGSGFPKSYDISKGIDKAAGAEREVVHYDRYRDGCDRRVQIESKSIFNGRNGNYATTPATPGAQAWQGYGTALKPSWEPVLLIRKPLEPVTSKELRGLTGWDFWHNSTDIKNIIKRRLKILKRYGVRLPSGWLEVKVTKISRKALHEGVESDVLFMVEASRQWRGNPTSSKLLAQVDVKRYRTWRTTANTADVLKHGCGGLNIDGGRITVDPQDKNHRQSSVAWNKKNPPAVTHGGSSGRPIENLNSQGRFPANLILDEESAAMLDELSGELLKAGNKKPSPVGKGTFGMGERLQANKSFGDSGGASRFFYCAKASSSERNAGLEGFEEKRAGSLECRNRKSEKGQFEGKPQYARNNHPTVKPLSLCKYLATLLLPPVSPSENGGARKLLVPFAGSGSEMIGAIQAGWDEVTGIEIDSDYCKIAEARIKYWAKQEKAKAPLFANEDEAKVYVKEKFHKIAKEMADEFPGTGMLEIDLGEEK